MTRAEYIDQRRAIRDASATRAERGLSKHPDGSGLHVCPRCNGAGVIDSDHSNPELVESHTCSLCCGQGDIVDGYRDPLLRLRYARQPRIRRTDPQQYEHLRRICATPSWRLRLMEQCAHMDITLEGALQAWRRVA